MEYDHLIVPGMNYRQSGETILEDVRKQAQEWHDKEFEARMLAGGNRADIIKRLEKDTETWVALEFQRRMNWNYQEEGTTTLD